ncbi:MAG: DUF1214 domain-containing protein [Acidimicrobiales bacterium]|jgi:hypothetical protein
MSGAGAVGGQATQEAWGLVRTMLDDMAAMVRSEAETELELVEGYRVLGRVTALCAELSLDVDPEDPWFFSMNSEARLVGGPNPDGAYHLAMIDGAHRYRISGTRGTVVYLGFQVLAGRGLTPRRMAAYVSDRDLVLDADGRFALVLSTTEPGASELAGATWVPIPDDSSAVVVRQYVADRAGEIPAGMAIECLDEVGAPPIPSDQATAEQLTAMAWTIAKLMTLHLTVLPEAVAQPNRLFTADAESLGGENTTPDNLYVLGTFRLARDEALIVEFVPPDSRYWSVTVENIWHECFDARRRRTSVTSAGASVRPDGTVRIVVAASPPPSAADGTTVWLDTGGRHRGFVVVRWLDNPAAPEVRTSVRPVGEA